LTVYWPEVGLPVSPFWRGTRRLAVDEHRRTVISACDPLYPSESNLTAGMPSLRKVY
jgi:hypothetical protein